MSLDKKPKSTRHLQTLIKSQSIADRIKNKPMKKQILSLLVAVGALTSIHAAPSSASIGDVLLGFQDTVQNKDYVVDLGPGSSLSSFSSINVGSDLAAVFGVNWNSDTNLFYGIFGVASNKSNVWASVLSGNNHLPTKAVGALGGALSGYTAVINNFNNELAYQGLTNGVYFNVGSGLDQGTATWTGNHPTASGATAFGTYNASLEGSVSSGDTLDVYQLGNTALAVTADFTATNGNAIQVTSNGTVQVVPEPSSYALIGFGALLLVVLYRRKVRA